MAVFRYDASRGLVLPAREIIHPSAVRLPRAAQRHLAAIAGGRGGRGGGLAGGGFLSAGGAPPIVNNPPLLAPGASLATLEAWRQTWGAQTGINTASWASIINVLYPNMPGGLSPLLELNFSDPLPGLGGAPSSLHGAWWTFQSTPTPVAGTGTVSWTSGSGQAAVGVGTSFTTACGIGDVLTAGGQTATVRAIASDTSLTVDTSGLATAASFTVTYTRLYRGSDATAPQSPPNVLQINFEVGTAPGNDTSDGSEREFGGWDSIASPTPKSLFYESLRFRILSITTAAGTGFEQQAIGAKLLGYWGVGDTSSSAIQIYGETNGNGSGTAVGTAFTFNIKEQNVFNVSMPQNVNTGALITVGPWHQFEAVFTLNTPSVANGGLQCWIDGVQTHNYTTVTWCTTAFPGGFFGRAYDAVWGGSGGTNKTRTDDLELDHLLIAA